MGKICNWFKKKEEKPSAYISIDEAVEILARARDTHVWYAEHPEYCKWTGPAEFHRDWIEEYTFCIELLGALKDVGAEKMLEIYLKGEK